MCTGSTSDDRNDKPPITDELSALFAGDLNPVAPKAQKKVPIPEGYVHIVTYINYTILCIYHRLDLDTWINPPPEESESSSDNEDMDNIFLPRHERTDNHNTSSSRHSAGSHHYQHHNSNNNKHTELTPEQLHKVRVYTRYGYIIICILLFIYIM